MKSSNFKYIIIIFSALVKGDWNYGISMTIQTNDSIPKIILQDIQPQFIVGNFSGKQTMDTLSFQYFSDVDEFEIKKIPTMENDWDSIIEWFNQTHQIHSYIASGDDTLFFESAYNLFCFFNMGDVNFDGIDEFAIVVNWLDYSNINSCRIYSICNNQFSLLKDFIIHESAFSQENIQDTSFIGIKGFLEKENNVWQFHDYNDDITDAYESGESKILQLEKCNNNHSN